MPQSLHSSNLFLHLLEVALTILVSLRYAYGDESQQDAWINPQAEGGEVWSPPSYMMGSTLTLRWATDFSVEYVLLYANDANPNHYEVLLGGLPVLYPLPARMRLIYSITGNQSTSSFGTSYNWTVATTFQLDYGFNLVLYNDSLGATYLDHFATVPFNITQNVTTSNSSTLPPAAATSTSANTANMSPTAVVFTIVTLTSTPSPSSTSAPGSTSITGVSYLTVIGLSIGLGVAVLFCLLLGLFVVLKRRRRARPKLTEYAPRFHGQPISRPVQEMPLRENPLQELYASDVPELHQ